MEKLTITLASQEDSPLLAAILTDATQRKVNYGDAAWGSGSWTNEETEKLIDEGSSFLVYRDSQLVGTVSLKWDDDPNWRDRQASAGYIHRVAIKHTFAGQGLGSKIIEWAETQALERGYRYIRLDCDSSNSKLCRYYEKNGFTRIATKETANPNYTAALYERPVGMVR